MTSSSDNYESCEDYFDDLPSVRKTRNAKSICYKSLFNSDDEEGSDEFEETQHDSDNDPDFKCSNNDESDGENRNDSDSLESEESADGGRSVMSNMTDFQLTLDMLNSSLGDKFLISKSDIADANHKSNSSPKPMSKRKISDECSALYGSALKNLWEKNYDVAMEKCAQIIKQYSTFWGSYDILAQIYEQKGDIKRANELYYTAALCNPKDHDKWIVCIENTKNSEGIDKAINAAKLAIARTNSRPIRQVLIDLLIEGGYERDALVKKLTNLHSSPCFTNKDDIEHEVEELFYMSEKFESWKEANRASECLEILNKKYPQYLTNDNRISLLKALSKLKRFNKVLNVSNNINGVTVNITDLTSISDVIVVEDCVEEVHKFDIIYAILMAMLHLKMSAAILHRSFSSHLKMLALSQDYFKTIIGKLFDFEFYDLVIENAQFALDKSDEKLTLLKFIGKSQEKLNLAEEALETYDYIINKINGRDPSIWELKANLLYSLKREQDAINVLSESQKFIYDESPVAHRDKFSRRPKPTKQSAQLLYKLCQLLHKEDRIDEYEKAAWKYIFIDSYEYFKTNKMKLFCEDLNFVKKNFYEITDSIWICINRIANGTSTECHVVFTSAYAKFPYETEAWNVLDNLLTLLIASYKDNMERIEILSQWGLVLHKLLNWNAEKRVKLSAIYISTAVINRLENVGMRDQCSSHMILSELKTWKIKFGDTVQFWNMFNLYSRLVGSVNNRYILRSMNQISQPYLLNIINAGYVGCSNIKLSIAINSKVYYEHPDNVQVCLQLAVTYLNAAVSRVCRDTAQPIQLAVYFLHQYRSLRGDCQEAWYNMARFFHRMSFFEYAIAYYEKCIATPPVGTTAKEKEMTDLTKEAAFNLVLIYRERNNRQMSAFITQKYLTI